MESDGTLAELIERSRKDLQKAKNDAEDAPRPKTACSAHDVQFALSQAQARAMDTILVVLLQLVRDGTGKMSWVRALRYPVAVVASVALFSPQAPALFEVILKHWAR